MTRMIGVLGTEATVRQAYVDDLAARFAGDCLVIRHGSAELVDLAEAKLRGERDRSGALSRGARRTVRQPGGDRIDVIVNACTHFPLVEDELAAAAPARCASSMAGRGSRGASRTDAGAGMAAFGPDVAVFTGAVEPALAPALARSASRESNAL